jgi:CheY-like chemotaxis protein
MAGSGRRILVADDSSTIQKVIKIAFSKHRAEIVEASSFIEALAAVTRAAPDALILDASLPGAHGPRDFSRLSESAGGAPVLLLLGTYESVDEGQFRAAGFEWFVKKPFESSDLVSLVERLLGDRDAPLVETDAPEPEPARGRGQHSTVIHPPGTFSGIEADPRATPGRGVDRSQDRQTGSGARGAPAADASAARTPGPVDGRGTPIPVRMPSIDDAIEQELGGENGTYGDPEVGVPPPPMIDHARKGRRAFDEGEATSGTGSRPGAGTGARPIAGEPPSQRFSLDDEDGDGLDLGGGEGQDGDGVPYEPAPAPLPRIPPSAGFGHGPGGGSDDGFDLDLGDPREPAPKSAGFGPGGGTGARRSPASEPVGVAGLDELRELVGAELPDLVRRAVVEYCERHFKGLAREVIAAELRRLADERARHLVDN